MIDLAVTGTTELVGEAVLRRLAFQHALSR